VVTAVDATTEEVRAGRPVVPARRWLLVRR
jgi:hypothetical protein